MKKMMISALLLTMCVAMSGCSSNQEPAQKEPSVQTGEQSQGDKSVVIGVSLLTLEHVFYQDIQKAIQDKAGELGVQVIIEDAESDLNTQFSQVQNFVTQEVDAILLCPVSTVGSSTAVDLAAEAGIPVFTLDNRSDSDKIISHIAADNYLGGEVAAEYMAEKVLPEGGNVVVITEPDVESCLYREQGFLKYFEENPDTGIQILSTTDGDNDTNTAMSVMQDLFTSFGEKIDAVYTVTDGMGFGVKSAIEAAGSDARIVSFTGNPQALAYIAEGTCFTATMRQDPDAMGGTSIENIVKYLKGEQVEKEMLVEPIPVDASNVNEYLK